MVHCQQDSELAAQRQREEIQRMLRLPPSFPPGRLGNTEMGQDGRVELFEIFQVLGENGLKYFGSSPKRVGKNERLESR
jgi:hypothetical protein